MLLVSGIIVGVYAFLLLGLWLIQGHPRKIKWIYPLSILLTITLSLSMLFTSVQAIPSKAQETGDQGFYNILPPGQQGLMNPIDFIGAKLFKKYPKHYNDQSTMYDSLGKRSPDITDKDLPTYYKDASLGAPVNPEKTYSPTQDLTIKRDNYGVPHIEGKTREATFYGIGYASAEDRLFLMDLLRHLGRAQLSEFAGDTEQNKALDAEQLKNSPYKEEDLTKQVQEICAKGEEGKQICEDMNNYAAGINDYISKAKLNWSLLPVEYLGLFKLPQEWKAEDSVVITSFVGGMFGKGGGGEVESGNFLAKLQNQFGESEGKKIWKDFHSSNDSEAPVTTNRSFPYNNHPSPDQKSSAVLDSSTANKTIAQLKKPKMVADGPFGPINLQAPQSMSNAMLVGGKHTQAGKPIAVFGPQTGYFNPQLLVEMDVNGPGMQARGVGFAGSNLYMQMGRGKDFSWSATSSQADNTDQWILQLCEPDGKEPTLQSDHYLYKGQCKPMESFTHNQSLQTIKKKQPKDIKAMLKKWKHTTPQKAFKKMQTSTKSKIGTRSTTIQRSVYGPVIARGTVKNKPVAISQQRSTYLNELGSTSGFKKLNDPEYMKGGAKAFSKAIDSIDYTFNWFYINKNDIAYKHSGLLPIRDPRTNPDLPSWGTGEYDWTGKFLSPNKQPQDINPANGYIISWNNKQAPNFRASDNNYNYGSVYRSLLLEKGLKKALAKNKKLTRADAVNITMDAGTTDFKAQEIYPYVLKILGNKAPDGNPQLQAIRDRLASWVTNGGHRRDIAPQDGKYDDATAIAIGDAFFANLVNEVFAPLKGIQAPLVATGESDAKIDDSPTHRLGSSFQIGYYPFLHKDLRQVLKENVKDPWHRTYCGNGDLTTCRTSLWKALSDTSNQLTNQYGSPALDNWVYDLNQDTIQQSTLGAIDLPNMTWMNRPTFQQVVQVGVPSP
ncbi:Acyl-homoserine lactone (AHL) acylase PvdQ [Marininema mesophilum]|uniref:Acyl-homoserine lactone (AHL) acylase PvdQ n=1 Tax=Marininema mesophilum TaxID=1048340 RepID=A0A1H3CQK9_9BACL|nr:penicillin acylase family protein [Marininema mesophilum]SDX56522.1 Acyl-homoserine lactone (AHL) acylase PvdQ [Marininema mesophilum]